MGQNPINFSKTDRMVLAIDIQPLLDLENPNPYITAILSSAETLLRFPPLSTTLFAFKLFFSSIPPLFPVSSEIRSFLTLSLSFNNPSHTLSSLVQALTSLPPLDSISQSLPKVSHFPKSLLQVVHDYPWHLLVNLSNSPNGLPTVPSNLVVLFSHFSNSLKCVSQYMERDSELLLRNVDSFGDKFIGVFSEVSKAFKDKNIHCCWVNVNCGLGCEDDDIVKLGHYERGIKRLGWNFCSTNSIVFGSTLVHFGLIYPKIGVLLTSLNSDDWLKPCHAKLSLEILDVNRKPLECNCCDLDLIGLNKMPTHRSGEGWLSFLSRDGDEVIKLHIRAAQKYNTCIKTKGRLLELILVRGSSAKYGDSSDFFADRILEMLSSGSNELFQKTTTPIWPILLSFLYRRGYWASVFLSKGNEISGRAVLKPFTSHSALIFVLDNESFSQNEIPDLQSSTSPLEEHPDIGDTKGIQKQVFSCNDLKWSSFFKEASENSNMVLEGIYFRRACKISKKLQFIRCWMKQVKKSSCIAPSFPLEYHPHVVNSNGIEEKSSELQQKSEQYVSLTPSKGSDSFAEFSTQGVPEHMVHPETSESFFSTLSEKIEDGIKCAEIDLGALAKRLVEKCIHLLNQKCDSTAASPSLSLSVESENTCKQMVSVLSKFLIMAPKDLAAKHKTSHQKSPSASENIVREYELQICFRMEILQSLVTSSSTMETTTSLFVEQISSLLEKIQLHLEDDFFGGISLEEYVEKTIKSRYCDKLGGVMDKIYKMDNLFLFEEESDELPNNLLWENQRSCEEKKEMTGSPKEDESLDPAHTQLLIQAQQRREMAKRSTWSRSSMKDLKRRLWVPKKKHNQNSHIKPKPISNQNPFQTYDNKACKSRRVRALGPHSPVALKKQKCSGSPLPVTDLDEVIMTPIIDNFCRRQSPSGCGINKGRCASKALFQD